MLALDGFDQLISAFTVYFLSIMLPINPVTLAFFKLHGLKSNPGSLVQKQVGSRLNISAPTEMSMFGVIGVPSTDKSVLALAPGSILGDSVQVA